MKKKCIKFCHLDNQQEYVESSRKYKQRITYELKRYNFYRTSIQIDNVHIQSILKYDNTIFYKTVSSFEHVYKGNQIKAKEPCPTPIILKLPRKTKKNTLTKSSSA